MKKEYFFKALISLGLAVAVGAAFLVMNTAMGDPSVMPPGNSLVPTFSGIRVNGPIYDSFGSVGQVDSILSCVYSGAATPTTCNKLQWKANVGGWTINGNDIYKTVDLGNVGIGTTTPTAKLDVMNGSIASSKSIIAQKAMMAPMSVSGLDLSLVQGSLMSLSPVDVSVFSVVGNLKAFGKVTGRQIGNFYRMGYLFTSKIGASDKWRVGACETGDIAVSCGAEVYNKNLIVNTFPSQENQATITSGNSGTGSALTVPAHSCYAKEYNSVGTAANYILWVKCFDPDNSSGGDAEIDQSCGPSCWYVPFDGATTGLILRFDGGSPKMQFKINGQTKDFDQVIEQIEMDPLIIDENIVKPNFDMPFEAGGVIEDIDGTTGF